MIPNARSDRNIGILKNRPFKVIVCAVTLAAFFVNIFSYDLAWAARTPLESTGVGSNRAGSPGVVKELKAETFALPAYLGHIKDSWQPSNDKTIQPFNHPTIIHIQDAHCNYAAQHKIAEIIGYLEKEYDVSVINLEGGARDYDLSIFTNISDRTVREKVADNFVREGLVSGAEYFAINNPEKVTLWGVEDPKLYIENLAAYRESLRYKETVEKELKTLSHILNNLKRHIYSKELFDLDLRYAAYKAGGLEFKDYLAFLVAKARERLIDIRAYKNVYLLGQCLEQEERIDFKTANAERDGLIDKLQKRLSKNAVEELVLKTLEFKTERISQRDFYAYLVRKAKSLNITLESFPELQKYIVYISMYATIDKPKVVEEVDSLENTLKESLCENDKQKDIARLSKNLTLLKNIFNISLTKEDYKYYKDNPDSFDMRNYSSFITKHAPAYGITAKLGKDVEHIDRYREDISKFYECSLKRDEAFLRNIRYPAISHQPSAFSPKITVLVTGGFHTENLGELFKKNNISYVSIMPNFRNGAGYECPYFRLLAGEITGIEKRLYSVLSVLPTSAIAIAPMLSPAISEKVWGDKRANTLKALAAIETALGGMSIYEIEETGLRGTDAIFIMRGRGTEIRVPVAQLRNLYGVSASKMTLAKAGETQRRSASGQAVQPTAQEITVKVPNREMGREDRLIISEKAKNDLLKYREVLEYFGKARGVVRNKIEFYAKGCVKRQPDNSNVLTELVVPDRDKVLILNFETTIPGLSTIGRDAYKAQFLFSIIATALRQKDGVLRFEKDSEEKPCLYAESGEDRDFPRRTSIHLSDISNPLNQLLTDDAIRKHFRGKIMFWRAKERKNITDKDIIKVVKKGISLDAKREDFWECIISPAGLSHTQHYTQRVENIMKEADADYLFAIHSHFKSVRQKWHNRLSLKDFGSILGGRTKWVALHSGMPDPDEEVRFWSKDQLMSEVIRNPEVRKKFRGELDDGEDDGKAEVMMIMTAINTGNKERLAQSPQEETLQAALYNCRGFVVFALEIFGDLGVGESLNRYHPDRREGILRYLKEAIEREVEDPGRREFLEGVFGLKAPSAPSRQSTSGKTAPRWLLPTILLSVNAFSLTPGITGASAAFGAKAGDSAAVSESPYYAEKIQFLRNLPAKLDADTAELLVRQWLRDTSLPISIRDKIHDILVSRGKKNDEEVIKALVMDMQDPEVTHETDQILAEIGGNGVVAALAKGMEEEKGLYCVRAIEVLRKIGSLEALELLNKLADVKYSAEEFYKVDEAVSAILDILRRQGAKIGKDRKIEILLNTYYLNGDIETNRIAAAVGLRVAMGAKSHGETVPALVEYFEKHNIFESPIGHIKEVASLITRCNALGISFPFRCRYGIMKEIVENREEKPDERLKDARPIAIVLYPVSDYNKAFFNTEGSVGSLMAKGYRVMYYEVGRPKIRVVNEIKNAFEDASAGRSGCVRAVILGSHGDRWHLYFGTNDPLWALINRLQILDMGDMPHLSGLGKHLEDGATVVSEGCSTGRGASNIATKLLAPTFPNATIFAPPKSTAFDRFVFNENDRITYVKFTNSDTLVIVNGEVVDPVRLLAEELRGIPALKGKKESELHEAARIINGLSGGACDLIRGQVGLILDSETNRPKVIEGVTRNMRTWYETKNIADITVEIIVEYFLHQLRQTTPSPADETTTPPPSRESASVVPGGKRLMTESGRVWELPAAVALPRHSASGKQASLMLDEEYLEGQDTAMSGVLDEIRKLNSSLESATSGIEREKLLNEVGEAENRANGILYNLTSHGLSIENTWVAGIKSRVDEIRRIAGLARRHQASLMKQIEEEKGKRKFGESGPRHNYNQDPFPARAYFKKGGWKLHLTVKPENYAAVDEWLFSNHLGSYKLLAGGDPGYEDFTIYIGSRIDTEEFARKIETDIGHLLEISTVGGPGERDMLFGEQKKVAGRFDIQGTEGGRRLGLGRAEASHEGIPFMAGGDIHPWDIETRKRKFGQIDNTRKELVEEYGEYFTGVPSSTRPSASGVAPEGPSPQEPESSAMHLVVAYRGMSLAEAEMIVKFGEVVRSDQNDNGTFSVGHDPSFQSSDASERRSEGREVLLQFRLPSSRLRPSGYAFTLVRTDADTVPEGYVEELKRRLAYAETGKKLHEENFLKAKTAYLEENPKDGLRKMRAHDPAFWSQPDVVAYVENQNALKHLPILIRRLDAGPLSEIAIVDASAIDWDKFEQDNRSAFASAHDRERFETIILPLIREGKQRWSGGDTAVNALSHGAIMHGFNPDEASPAAGRPSASGEREAVYKNLKSFINRSELGSMPEVTKLSNVMAAVFNMGNGDWTGEKGEYNRAADVNWHDFTHVGKNTLETLKAMLANIPEPERDVYLKAALLTAIAGICHDVGYYKSDNSFGTMKIGHEQRSKEFVLGYEEKLDITNPQDKVLISLIISATEAFVTPEKWNELSEMIESGDMQAVKTKIAEIARFSEINKNITQDFYDEKRGLKENVILDLDLLRHVILGAKLLASLDIYDTREDAVTRMGDLRDEFVTDRDTLEGIVKNAESEQELQKSKKGISDSPLGQVGGSHFFYIGHADDRVERLGVWGMISEDARKTFEITREVVEIAFNKKLNGELNDDVAKALIAEATDALSARASVSKQAAPPIGIAPSPYSSLADIEKDLKKYFELHPEGWPVSLKRDNDGVPKVVHEDVLKKLAASTSAKDKIVKWAAEQAFMLIHLTAPETLTDIFPDAEEGIVKRIPVSERVVVEVLKPVDGDELWSGFFVDKASGRLLVTDQFSLPAKISSICSGLGMNVPPRNVRIDEDGYIYVIEEIRGDGRVTEETSRLKEILERNLSEEKAELGRIPYRLITCPVTAQTRLERSMDSEGFENTIKNHRLGYLGRATISKEDEGGCYLGLSGNTSGDNAQKIGYGFVSFRPTITLGNVILGEELPDARVEWVTGYDVVIEEGHEEGHKLLTLVDTKSPTSSQILPRGAVIKESGTRAGEDDIERLAGKINRLNLLTLLHGRGDRLLLQVVTTDQIPLQDFFTNGGYIVVQDEAREETWRGVRALLGREEARLGAPRLYAQSRLGSYGERLPSDIDIIVKVAQKYGVILSNDAAWGFSELMREEEAEWRGGKRDLLVKEKGVSSKERFRTKLDNIANESKGNVDISWIFAHAFADISGMTPAEVLDLPATAKRLSWYVKQLYGKSITLTGKQAEIYLNCGSSEEAKKFLNGIITPKVGREYDYSVMGRAPPTLPAQPLTPPGGNPLGPPSGLSLVPIKPEEPVSPRAPTISRASASGFMAKLVTEHPTVNTLAMRGLLEQLPSDQGLQALEAYLAKIYDAASEVMAATPDPGEPRTVFLPLSSRFCPIDPIIMKGALTKGWKELRDNLSRKYSFSNITVIFYDGTLEDLNSKKKESCNTGNAFAYIDESAARANPRLYRTISKNMTTVMETAEADKPVFVSIGGHIVLALGLLDIVRNDRDDAEYTTKVVNLLNALSKESNATPDNLRELLKKGELKIVLPPIQKVDMERMREYAIMDEAVSTAL